MPIATVNRTAIHYEDAGRGVPLVLVHGSGGSGDVWRHQIDALAGVARVIVPDLPGHGRSGGEGPTKIADSVDVVRGLLDVLRIDRALVGGHSMGGAVAQGFALAYPARLAGLVLVGTGARLKVLPTILSELERDYPAGVRYLTERAVGKDAPDALKESVYRLTLAAPQRVLVGDFRACDAFDVMTRVGTITAPTMIVCGADDVLTPPKYAEFLRDRIPGARLVLVEGAGHYVQLERPDETTAAIRSLVARVADPR